MLFKKSLNISHILYKKIPFKYPLYAKSNEVRMQGVELPQIEGDHTQMLDYRSSVQNEYFEIPVTNFKFKFKLNLFGFISSHFTIKIDEMIMLSQRCGCHQKRRA